MLQKKSVFKIFFDFWDILFIMLERRLHVFYSVILFSVFMVPVYSLQIPAMSAEESLVARNKMIEYSKQFVGVPYVYGGTDKNGMDCSGLIFTVARESIGVQLPRTTSALYAALRIINDNEKEPGDIVFFKTVGNRISHAGLYMGNDQFIHAVSDGPNTGVIVSSLKENYWKNAYAGVGQFLPPTGKQDRTAATAGASGTGVSAGASGISVDAVSSGSSGGGGSPDGGWGSFARSLMLDATVTGDWNLFTAKRFLLNFRGVTVDMHLRTTRWNLQPGFGIAFNYDPQMKLFRMPVVLSLTVLRGLRVYAGPVFFIGSAVEPGTGDTENPVNVKPSIFPGTIGLVWQTPSIQAGPVDLSLVQDIHYSVVNDVDGSALPFVSALASGLVCSTGIRVTFPMSRFL